MKLHKFTFTISGMGYNSEDALRAFSDDPGVPDDDYEEGPEMGLCQVCGNWVKINDFQEHLGDHCPAIESADMTYLEVLKMFDYFDL